MHERRYLQPVRELDRVALDVDLAEVDPLASLPGISSGRPGADHGRRASPPAGESDAVDRPR